jgi:peptidase M50B-like protein
VAAVQLKERTRWGHLGGLLVILTAAVLLWNTPFTFPLRILTVFFHEMSHGLMALLTGGSIKEIEVVKEEGGKCITEGGSRFLVLSAGYLGSLLWGGTILVFATRTRFDRAISAVLGVLLILITVLWVKPAGSFGFLFGLMAGTGMFAVSQLSGTINDYILKSIGLTSCISAILDIKDDVLDRPGEHSDAFFLSQEIGLPVLFWGILWMALAGLATLFFLSQVAKASVPVESAPQVPGPRPGAGVPR